MAFESVGINLFGDHLAGREPAEDLRYLGARPDFVEVGPHGMGAILGGGLDAGRRAPSPRSCGNGGAFTVHAPHSLNLMDVGDLGLQRAGSRPASGSRARSGPGGGLPRRQAGARHARYALRDPLRRRAGRPGAVGDVAAGLGVTLAVENSYPEPPILRGESDAYAAWPSELAGQVAAGTTPRSASAWTWATRRWRPAPSASTSSRSAPPPPPSCGTCTSTTTWAAPSRKTASPASPSAWPTGRRPAPASRTREDPPRELFRTVPGSPVNPPSASSCTPTLRPLAREAIQAARELSFQQTAIGHQPLPNR